MDDTLRKVIKQANESLWYIHRDIATLLTTLDSLMNIEGWRPTERNRISDDLSNGLNPKRWRLKSAYRIYVRESLDEVATEMIGFQVALEPAAFDEPMCLIIGARFAEPVAFKEIWQQWGADSDAIFASHSEKPLEPITEALLKQSLKLAVSASAFAIPMCDLDCEQSLRDRLLSPSIRLIGELLRTKGED